MQITFGILAALITAVSIWVGYLNSQAKDTQQKHLKTEIGIHTGKTNRHNDLLAEIKGYNTKYKTQLINVEENLNVKDTNQAEKIGLDEKLATLNAEIKDLETRLADYKSKIPDIGEVDRLIANLLDAKKAITQLDAAISQLKQDNEKLTVEIASQNETITYNKRWMKNHTEYVGQQELKGKVKAIYKDWGFVVVNSGDLAGVTPRSILLVMRGEEIICEVKVKNATNTAATAEIMFDTMKEDDFIQIGDVVIAKAKAPKKDPGANNGETDEPADQPDQPEDQPDPFASPF